jgi:hypothetical protein
LVTSTSRQIR